MQKHVLFILLLLPLSLFAQVTRDSVASKDTISFRIQEVEVLGHQSISSPESSQMSAVEIPMLQIQTIPALGGEVDVIKAIQLLPGVQSASDGSTGVYVRGGGPDENLILLDGVPLYNVSHAMGMFSVFNADMLQNVTLYKGNFPARYGSRLSSVIDVEQTAGSNTMWHGGVNVGLISAKLNVQGPIFTGEQLRARKLSDQKDTIIARTTFAVAARRTYYDALLAPLMAAVSSTQMDGGSAVGGYYFYDVNAKLQHRFPNNDRLTASFYMGDDVIYVRYRAEDSYRSGEGSGSTEQNQTNLGLRWTSGNIMAKLQYDHRLRENLSMQAHLSFLRFGYNLSEQMNSKVTSSETGTSTLDQSFDYSSKLIDAAAHTDWLYESEQHSVHFGAGYELHTFRPQIGNLMFAEMGMSELNFDTVYTSSTTFGHEAYLYAEDTYKPVNWFTLNYGLRASMYGIRGKVYPSIEPRVGMRFLLHKDVAFKASYSYMSQYVHLLSNTSISSPTDLWVPVTADIPPMRSMQVAAGLSYDILGQAELSVESYYKRSTNLVEYKEGASFFGLSGSGWEDKVAVGNGWSYGVELLLQRKVGPVTGWIGYTWSRTMRQFDREGMVINNGKPYHAKYDREHDLSITLQYRITPKFEIAGTFVYGTGSRATLATQKYFEPQERVWVDYISERNNFQMPDYHRLDLALNWHLPHKRSGDPAKSKGGWLKDAEHLVSLSVYNVYCRKNPYMMIIEGNKLMQISLFPILPTVSYGFKF